ncbi:485_t:CDS:2 [Funneliformis geosporum]|uniref:12666_t:CDS:1 n=1 Tax=Funneliformis geosporum TaxID=1117311 RepID=A0A9W4SDA8_9GLOM|nr:12666_t:CDS:2 [Funneliformis geosporum]CAI2167028.1 485_t:CDS:2 [Funneliformis geosporum]
MRICRTNVFYQDLYISIRLLSSQHSMQRDIFMTQDNANNIACVLRKKDTREKI